MVYNTEGAKSTGSVEEKPISQEVIGRVADELGVGTLDLPPLYRSIDPDALDKLFAGRSTLHDARVTFRFAGCQVTVTGPNKVSVEQQPDSDNNQAQG